MPCARGARVCEVEPEHAERKRSAAELKVDDCVRDPVAKRRLTAAARVEHRVEAFGVQPDGGQLPESSLARVGSLHRVVECTWSTSIPASRNRSVLSFRSNRSMQCVDRPADWSTP